ncbi:Hsp20 family protein [Futiania mangrovi]|uniref:Hsp20 family protein n=1 Tax=Futiania mangrovi TaxID=2959716 RepID=A0A9J6PEU3_9PROT|nr:Hsp20 family protein [Futiania mangrovii]MCP1337209.1 Hsp20 family protein [Futiania mangrovii]
MSLFSSPQLLGFDHVERMLEQLSKSGGESYPPYNIEQLGEDRLRITLAVAGFRLEELSITLKDKHLVIAGKQTEDVDRVYLHRGIAARQFQRSFLLADGIEVEGARMADGLLHIELRRPQTQEVVREIKITPAGS